MEVKITQSRKFGGKKSIKTYKKKIPNPLVSKRR
jgi:hypothetical protein